MTVTTATVTRPGLLARLIAFRRGTSVPVTCPTRPGADRDGVTRTYRPDHLSECRRLILDGLTSKYNVDS